MKYLAAYMLLKLGGAEEVTADDIRKVVSAAGAEVDDDRVAALLQAVNGRSIDELVTEGRSKMESVAGVAVAAASAAPAAAAAGGGDSGAAAASADKGAAKEEPKEESDEDLGFGLFD
ncbi:60S acidic ribosomal protein P2 [Cyanidioschyzon merolae strain 10D]|jgi:large subunit ribosomal protein LP2|uniref:60S acidic ribosomal protein P2 n=1 Tax=Cyanidioschyzon merolae (strain NIES-3377 / 10D) TaxID=280699 RepID=M1VBF0_CYAM1|nr:60S acidic ribosomal protein P2 [Cyanidioschyzon merolae strain 10D]BAM79632.1 60S acidic ribosomal protein P2 [Cyanidioschyzon merolae strain 10D]|eukprot:XP_005535918.1 60S acidic ribosomal protein P2 [Cyanidioschyzon merolae strain 10D]